MDFYRFQNGERKQPDYIVIFKEKGDKFGRDSAFEEQLQEAMQASQQFLEATGKALPIIIVDRGACRETERNLTEEDRAKEEAIDRERRGKRKEERKEENNGREKTKSKEKHGKIGLEDCEGIDGEVTPENRKKYRRDFRRMYKQMEEIIHPDKKSQEVVQNERE